MADLAAWKELIERLRAKGAAISQDCAVPLTDAGPREPGVVALTLLNRTLSTVEAATLLLDKEMVVEARTLVRTLYENLFCVADLAKRGAAFVEDLKFDDLHNRKARAGGLLEFAKAQTEKADFVEELEAFRADLQAWPEKTYALRFEQAAQRGNVLPGYVVYRELSTDAAHPSATSLSRHITLNDDPDIAPFSVVGYPPTSDIELHDTAALLCSATVGVLVGVNEVLGDVKTGETLSALFDAFKVLDASNTAERQAAEAG